MTYMRALFDLGVRVSDRTPGDHMLRLVPALLSKLRTVELKPPG